MRTCLGTTLKIDHLLDGQIKELRRCLVKSMGEPRSTRHSDLLST